MRRLHKVVVLAAITALVLTLPLAAQYIQLEPSIFASNTLAATSGVFDRDTDADNSMSYFFYSNVDFEKWFGFATWNSSSGCLPEKDLYNTIYKASLGYASKFGGIYVGAWYNGNIVSIESADYKETITPTYNWMHETLENTITVKDYGWTGVLPPVVESTNQLEILLGIGGMGIKVGFFESLFHNKLDAALSFTKSENRDGNINYNDEPVDFKLVTGHLMPYLGWGGQFGSLRPYVELGIDIYQEKKNLSTKDYDTYLGQVIGWERTKYDYGYNNSYIKPTAKLGAEFDLAKKGTTETMIGLEYGLKLKLYNNDYDSSGFSGSVKGPVEWDDSGYFTTTTNGRRVYTEKEQSIDYAETTDMNHRIVPAFRVTSEPAEFFKLGFKAALPVTFSMVKEDRFSDYFYYENERYDQPDIYPDWAYTYTQTNHTPRGLKETSTLGISAKLDLGASVQLVPERFAINGGISATPLSFKRTSEKISPNGVGTVKHWKRYDGYGDLTSENIQVSHDPLVPIDDEVKTNLSWDSMKFGFSGGFVFNFAPQAAVDLLVSSSGTWNKLDLTDLNVLFTFKF